MQANYLTLLKEMKSTPYYEALTKMLDAEMTRMLSDLVYATDEHRMRQLQGGIFAIQGIIKVLDDVDLLRSLQDNANAHPVVDKE